MPATFKQISTARAQQGLAGRAVVLLLLATTLLALLAWRWFEHSVSMPASRVEVRIEQGASARTVAKRLNEAGIAMNEALFIATARASGVTQRLRAGRYEFTRGMSVHDVIDKLKRGEVLRERLTIVEGWTLRDLRRVLDAHPELRHDSRALNARELLKAIGATESHPEGLFAPDTYVFDPGSSDLELLRQAYQAQAARLNTVWQGRDASLPYKSPYELLIMASIVEKETGLAAERRQVAAVFVNRLRKGMLLQTDPTVIYGLGEKFDGNLRKQDLLTDTPYNSYTRAGLPPTPIALPGRAALEAAVTPAPSKALYFVARGDGSSHFSETLTEHNRAVIKYQLNNAGRRTP